jgi:phosphonate transport system permease protein
VSLALAVPHSELPSVRFRRRLTVVAVSTAGVAAALAFMDANPLALIRDFHFVVNLVSQMLPPNIALLWHKKSILASLVDTVSIAFLSTIGGATIAFGLALLASHNTTPHRGVRLAVRSLLATERCTPNLAVLLVLLIAVGIGPFAAMLTLLLGSIGMFGKLFADAIEQVDQGPLDATAVTGASRLQIIRYAVLPQVAPSIVANVFYAFDVNLRAVVALGVFGGGGIGFEMNLARSVLRYRDMLACVVVIIVMINLMERVADMLRKRIFSLEARL